MTTAVHFIEYKNDGHLYLLVVDTEKGRAKSGAGFLVRPSLLRPEAGMQPVVHPSDFLPQMSIVVDRGARDGTTAYLLRSNLYDESSLTSAFPLLGRKIISDLVRWGSNKLKIFGEFTYIPKYWEWTEDILSHHGDTLKKCSIYEAVYASLYSYDRDPNVFRAFCESWCPTTNTLHTLVGEVSISLWDLHKMSGLPISGVIYDETIPSCSILQGKDQHGYRLVPRACEHLFIAYCRLEKKSQAGVSAEQWIDFWCKKTLVYEAPPKRCPYSDSFPRSTHNPSGNIASQSRAWTAQELETFGELGITEERVRERTYLAAFLSCWLCAFVLPKTEDRLIRPSTFEIAAHMAAQSKFSLAIPVLANIYRGLNGIANSYKPAYSEYCFPAHYLYTWLAHYFGTHYAAHPCPPGPAMVRYSGAKGAKLMKDDEARKLIHEGESINWGCMMFNKNQKDTLFDDGTLEPPRLDYLISLRSGYLPLRRRDSFHIEPYSPHRFSRQFGFCQGIPGKLLDANPVRTVPYNKALKYWKLLLCEGSQSKVLLPYHTSELSQYVTAQFHDWWNKVNVNDLRDKIAILIRKGIESDPSKSWKNKKFKTLKDAFAENLNLDNERLGETSAVYMTANQDSSTIRKTWRNHKTEVDSDNSNRGSNANFKNNAGKRRRRSSMSNVEDPKTIYGSNLFEDMCSSSNMSQDLALNGLFEFEQKMPHTNESLPAKSNHEPQTSGSEPHQAINNGMVKQVAPNDSIKKPFMEDKEIEGSSMDSQNVIQGPHSFNRTTKKSMDASQKASHAKLSHVQIDFAPPPSVTSFELGPVSTNIFAEAIRDIGAKYLASLKEVPFHEVEKRYKEANMVYKGIEKLQGDPTPLKSKVDFYVTSVKSYLALERATAKRKRPDQLRKQMVTHTNRVDQAESNLNDARANYNILEKKFSEVEVKIAILEVELRDAREKQQKLKSNLEVMGSLVAQAETQVTKTKQALTKVEASQILSPEEIAKLDEQRRNLLELQKSIKPLEWMDLK